MFVPYVVLVVVNFQWHDAAWPFLMKYVADVHASTHLKHCVTANSAVAVVPIRAGK